MSRGKSPPLLPVRVGLLGGGQLARMLILKGHQMGLSMKVLCASKDEPAAQVTPHVVLGDPKNAKDVLAFANHVDLLTFESEFYDGAMLAEVAEQTSVRIFPSPRVLSQLQDRLTQKAALFDLKVPTAPFMRIETADDVFLATEAFENKFVLKKRKGGYDGYGTIIVKSESDLQMAYGILESSKDFWIAEAFVPFQRELAVQLARTPDGEVAVFPMVETHQVDQRLDWLTGPVQKKGSELFLRKLTKFMKSIDYVGVMAFELFEAKGQLLVNEIAPRVHNSGHATLEACTVDQFTQHLRAVLNLSLEKPLPVSKGFALVNLIGQGGSQPRFPRGFQSHLHWYGKQECRKGRKMGHLTITGDSGKKCLQQLLRERKAFQL